MKTLVLLLFSVAWAGVAFAVIRAIVIAWGYHRRFATATAFAVAAAFVLGAASPLSFSQRLGSRDTGAPAAPAAVPHPIACAATVKVVATPGQGHIDSLKVAGAEVDLSKEIEVKAGAAARIGGWLLATNGPAGGLCVLVDGRPVAFEGSYGVDRPDVATATGKPADRGAGFDVKLALPKGSHVITIGPVQPDGSVTPLGQPLKVHGS
jgi:hypothetical protein